MTTSVFHSFHRQAKNYFQYILQEASNKIAMKNSQAVRMVNGTLYRGTPEGYYPPPKVPQLPTYPDGSKENCYVYTIDVPNITKTIQGYKHFDNLPTGHTCSISNNRPTYSSGYAMAQSNALNL